MPKELVVVVHGVGVREAGISTDLLSLALDPDPPKAPAAQERLARATRHKARGATRARIDAAATTDADADAPPDAPPEAPADALTEAPDATPDPPLDWRPHSSDDFPPARA
jgi:hypothetical protein